MKDLAYPYFDNLILIVGKICSILIVKIIYEQRER